MSAGELKSSHADVCFVRDFLMNVYGFSDDKEYMTILMDDEDHTTPTRENILNAMKNLAANSEPGDAVFVLFSGHGCRIAEKGGAGGNVDQYQEVIIPSDYEWEMSGVIPDMDIFQSLLVPMKKGVMVTCVLDILCDLFPI